MAKKEFQIRVHVHTQCSVTFFPHAKKITIKQQFCSQTHHRDWYFNSSSGRQKNRRQSNSSLDSNFRFSSLHNNLMTSFAHDLSDNNGVDEQKKHSEFTDHSSSPETRISPSVTTSNIPYTTPQHAAAPAAYPYPDPYYRSIFAPYHAQSYPPQPYGQPMVHLQLMGIQQAGVPLPSDAIEEPVFVNAKQYQGILRRRQFRAKAESENKLAKSRKPYLHESRHLHALKRARGAGGRFLNAKKNENKQNEATSGDKSQSNINLNSDKNEVASTEGKY